MQPQRKQEPYSGEQNRAGSTKYAELDSFRRVPIDANYQSLVKTRDQIGTCANYENIQRGALFNMRSNPGNNEDPYEEVTAKGWCFLMFSRYLSILRLYTCWTSN